MKTEVILLTLLTAIWNTHASAVNTKLLNFETVLALCNYLHVFIIFRRICGKNKLLFFRVHDLNQKNVTIGFLLFFFALLILRFFTIADDLIDWMIDEWIQAISFNLDGLFRCRLWILFYLRPYSLELWNWARPYSDILFCQRHYFSV